MARPAAPPWAVLCWLALPLSATFTPSLKTCTSASVSVRCLPGSSTRTYRPFTALPASTAFASSGGRPPSSAFTFG